MALEWRDSLDSIDWDELSALYRIAPMGEKKPADLKVVFGNSMFRCLVYDGGKLVGAGRVLADGLDCAYLCDIAVHPDLQGQGMGKQIVTHLTGLARGHKKIILYAVAGKEPFYSKLGFKRMLTAMGIFASGQQAVDAGLLEED